jgi:hypothetical protein
MPLDSSQAVANRGVEQAFMPCGKSGLKSSPPGQSVEERAFRPALKIQTLGASAPVMGGPPMLMWHSFGVPGAPGFGALGLRCPRLCMFFPMSSMSRFPALVFR